MNEDLKQRIKNMAKQLELTASSAGGWPFVEKEAALFRELLAKIEELEARPCPHVKTGKEGTSYCELAETNAMPTSEPMEMGHLKADMSGPVPGTDQE